MMILNYESKKELKENIGNRLRYFETNQSDGGMGISRCDNCELFEDDLEAQLFVVSLLDSIKIDWTWKYSHLYPEYDTIGHKKKERVIA